MLASKGDMIRTGNIEEATSIANSRTELGITLIIYNYLSLPQANCTVKDEVDAVMSTEVVLTLLKLLKDYLQNLKSSTSTLQMRLVRQHLAYVL